MTIAELLQLPLSTVINYLLDILLKGGVVVMILAGIYWSIRIPWEYWEKKKQGKTKIVTIRTGNGLVQRRRN
jgi:hypothetical protein